MVKIIYTKEIDTECVVRTGCDYSRTQFLEEDLRQEISSLYS